MLADSLPRALAALVLLTVSCDRGSLPTSPDPPESPESPAILLESGREGLHEVEWSADGTEIYYSYSVGGHRQLAARGATPGAAERVLDSSRGYSELEVSSDGKWIYFTDYLDGSQVSLYRIATESGAPQLLVRGINSSWWLRPLDHNSYLLSPDASHVAFIRLDGDFAETGPETSLILLDATTAEERVVIAGALLELVSFAPDNSKILYHESREGVDEGFYIADIESGSIQPYPVSYEGILDAWQWGLRGPRFVIQSYPDLLLHEPAFGTPPTVLVEGDKEAYSFFRFAAWSPTGPVASVGSVCAHGERFSCSRYRYAIFETDDQGGPATLLATASGNAWSGSAYAPDGRRLAFAVGDRLFVTEP